MMQSIHDRQSHLAEIEENQKSEVLSVDFNPDVVYKFNKTIMGTTVFLEACLHTVENIICFNVSVDLFVYYVF